MRKIKIFELDCKLFSVALLVLGFSLAATSSARTLIFQPGSSTPSNASAQQTVQSGTSPLTAVLPQSNTASNELFFMIEQLQQEVNMLRGIIEEQGQQIRMLQQSGRDRYVDMDTRVLDLTRRIAELSSAPQSAAPQARPAVASVQASAPSQVAKPKAEASKVEKDAYNQAYGLIKDKRFDDAILALFAFTENYPESPLLPNVYYWLGEVYLATSKLEQAKTSFTLVVTAYPEHQKVADALYKLGETLHRLGQSDLARQYFADVRNRFPNSSAAKLAENYSFAP